MRASSSSLPWFLADIEVAHQLPRRKEAIPHQPTSPQRPGQHHSSGTRETGDEAGDAATLCQQNSAP